MKAKRLLTCVSIYLVSSLAILIDCFRSAFLRLSQGLVLCEMDFCTGESPNWYDYKFYILF